MRRVSRIALFVAILLSYYQMGRKPMILTVKEAAERLGISPQRVRLLLAQGRIKGKKLGHDWVVLDLSYTRMKRGRKRKVVERKESEFEQMLREYVESAKQWSPPDEVK